MPGADLGRPLLPLESVDPIRIAEGYYLQPAGRIAAKGADRAEDAYDEAPP
ncbi:hypothetical protein [Streptomyces eurythermus]|uniref:hypothetical protein n=1 Tax=Streptomyces eurythermus TaxID=42237 RepID=UPI0033ED4A34